MKKDSSIRVPLLQTSILNGYAYQQNRVPVHNPSAVGEPATKFYNILGFHDAAALRRVYHQWTQGII
ncbi:MAG: hypothetical protein K6G32_10110 [Prevotella sp.]|nr:hypothetical protein [Prevotella sp.]